MFLKRLDLQGFKTFASRTEIEFSGGLTCVVGPNGSGKSNVADGIRWVLGEQSLRALRCKKTEDVIFAGGAGRPSAGMAEVSIAFDNATGWYRERAGRTRPKIPLITLVERGGKARSIQAENITARTLRQAVLENAKTESRLMTDELRAYRRIGYRFASHETVKHSEEEYVRGDAHTNTIEGFFSIFKRGVVGTYHHISATHLHRYLAEFDFRYSHRVKLGFDDTERARLAIRGAIGKRLTYRQPNHGAHV